jgi:hypothetical protein
MREVRSLASGTTYIQETRIKLGKLEGIPQGEIGISSVYLGQAHKEN